MFPILAKGKHEDKAPPVKKFVARQPILNRDQNIYGYELLFRSGLENYFRSTHPDQASSSVIADSFLLFGVKSLTQGRKAFINFTHKLITSLSVTLLPQEQVVMEVLEDIQPDDQVIGACRALKQHGYMIALDDFVFSEKLKPLIDLADIIKVDFLATPPLVRKHLVRSYAHRGIKMLAEKVETHEQFHEAMELGYKYFQGFFFSKPEIVSCSDVPAYKHHYLLLLQEINRPEPDFIKLEEVIKRESSLCYKLLRYLNSAAFAFSREITSIRHALSLIGVEEVRKWASLLVLAGMGEDKPSALVLGSIVRAKFCEDLAPATGLANRAMDLFLMGLLSMMDAIVERPMAEILSELVISRDIKTALLQGRDRNRFRDIYELVLAYERGDWEEISRLAAAMRANEDRIAEAYLAAVKWSQEVLEMDRVASAV
jgi:EAL and modified HD-GYP domain-containing signal transduction protein